MIVLLITCLQGCRNQAEIYFGHSWWIFTPNVCTWFARPEGLGHIDAMSLVSVLASFNCRGIILFKRSLPATFLFRHPSLIYYESSKTISLMEIGNLHPDQALHCIAFITIHSNVATNIGIWVEVNTEIDPHLLILRIQFQCVSPIRVNKIFALMPSVPSELRAMSLTPKTREQFNDENVKCWRHWSFQFSWALFAGGTLVL